MIAGGDSYNDTAMLGEAHAGILFRPPPNVMAAVPAVPGGPRLRRAPRRHRRRRRPHRRLTREECPCGSTESSSTVRRPPARACWRWAGSPTPRRPQPGSATPARRRGAARLPRRGPPAPLHAAAAGPGAGGGPHREAAAAARQGGAAHRARPATPRCWSPGSSEARGRLGAPYRGALDWLLDRIERRRAEAARRVLEEALPRFRRLAPRLTRRLSARPAPGPDGPATLAALLAGAVRAQARALREALGAVVGGEDAVGLHRARIEGKRLRYLLEPLRGLPGADATEAVAALKGLQDLLGTWHDLHRARETLAGALVEAAADRARRGRDAGSGDLRPGLLAIDQLAAREADEIYGQLAEGYLRSRATGILDLAYAVVAGLEGAGGRGPGPGRPRRSGGCSSPACRPRPSGGEVVEAALGWLPGEQEHVGRVRSARRARGGSGSAPRRAARSRLGRSRAPTSRPGGRSPRGGGSPAAATGPRPSRAGASTSSPTGGWCWRWSRPGGEPTPPAWLEPVVVRDVTGERGYRDEALARRAPRG